ncbi:hypothetical protein DL95DRAFT_267280, partial [Leptodontidium sp. 2 PMI_412]
MSFGVGVGDFLAVGRLVLDLYNACKDAPGEFQEICRELSSIHTVLSGLATQAQDPTSLSALGRMEPALGRIEVMLRESVKEERRGEKEPTVLSAYENNDTISWEKIERDLALEGVSKQEFEKNKDRIK